MVRKTGNMSNELFNLILFMAVYGFVSLFVDIAALIVKIIITINKI